MERETWADEAVRLLWQSGDGSFYRLQYFSKVDSTNEAVKRAADMSPGSGAGPSDDAGEGLVIIGEEQTAGKGRRGRSWTSPAGESVYFSVLLRPSVPAEACSEVTLVAGLSVAQTLRILYGLDARIKWPNDIVVEGKKVCGILTEGILAGNALAGAVTGIGINVNNRSFPEGIAHRATSVLLEIQRSGERKNQRAGEEKVQREWGRNGLSDKLPGMPSNMSVDRAQLLASVLQNFRRYYAVFCEDGSMSALREEYESLLAGRGSSVVIEDPAGSYSGTCLGIDDRGCLLVEREDGAFVRVSSGEVSVRGIYGYAAP